MNKSELQELCGVRQWSSPVSLEKSVCVPSAFLLSGPLPYRQFLCVVCLGSELHQHQHQHRPHHHDSPWIREDARHAGPSPLSAAPSTKRFNTPNKERKPDAAHR